MRFLLDFLSERVSFRSLAVIEAVFLGLTFADLVDFTIRTVSGLIAIAVGIVAWRNYRLKNKLLEQEIEKKDQELHEYLKTQKLNAK
jgi:hypothetical protein